MSYLRAQVGDPSPPVRATTSTGGDSIAGSNGSGIRILHHGTNGVANVDIVAVHGLNGDRMKTWTHPDNEIMWLRDLLPTDVPDSRIMTFGYDVKIRRTKITADLMDHAKCLLLELAILRENLAPNAATRPIIFVCHSLGGLLVKEALCTASGHDARGFGFNKIYDSTWGIVSNRVFGFSWDMAGFLRNDAPALRELDRKFRSIASRFVVKSFYELGRYGGMTKIVETSSATLGLTSGSGLGQEQAIPVPLDHQAMCRFSDGSDTFYVAAVRAIKDIRREHDPAPLSQRETDLPAAEERCPATRVRETEISIATMSCEELRAILKRESSLTRPACDIDDIEEASNGTCQWILQAPEYLKWLEGPPMSTLLVTGKMGCGKSVTTKSLVRKHLASVAEKRECEDNIAVVYYVCSRVTRLDESATSMLKSIIFQLLKTITGQVSLGRSIRSSEDVLTMPPDSLWVILKSLLEIAIEDAIFCFVDAIDECEEESVETFLKGLRTVSEAGAAAASRTRFRLFISRRSNTAEVPGFQNIDGLFHLQITEDTVRRDMWKMVRQDHDVKQIIRRLSQPPEKEEELSQALVENSEGMFQWVKFAIRHTRTHLRGRTYNEMLKSVKDLPRGLEGLYKGILDEMWPRMSPEEANLARKIMAWVLLARQPLDLEQMIMAVSLTDKNDKLPSPADQRTGLADFVATNLTPLIELVARPVKLQPEHASQQLTDTTTTTTTPNPIIRPIHESVRQFLWQAFIEPRGADGEQQPFYIGLSAGHEIITRACLAYVRCCEFQVGTTGFLGHTVADEKGMYPWDSETAAEIDSFSAKYTLIKYCADDWNIWHHLRFCQVRQEPDTFDLAVEVIACSLKAFNLLWQIRQYMARYGEQKPRDIFPEQSLAHIFASVVSLEMLERAVSQIPDLDLCGQDRSGSTTMVMALGTGASNVSGTEREKIAMFFLGRGVDVSAPDHCGRTLAFWVAGLGYTEVLRKIIDRFSLDHRDEIDGDTILHRAMCYNSLDTARFLLDEGADCNAKNRHGKTPIWEACRNGHLEMVRLALEHGADLAVTTSDGLELMHEVIFETWSSGDTVMLETLLRHGAPRGAVGEPPHVFSPLHFAAEIGSPVALHLLREAGAILDATTDDYEPQGLTPLHIAAQSGQSDAARVLSELGADLNFKAANGETPLLKAYLHGNHDVALTLLELGSNPQDSEDQPTAPYHFPIIIVEMILRGKFAEAKNALAEKSGLDTSESDTERSDTLPARIAHAIFQENNENLATMLQQPLEAIDQRTVKLQNFTALHLASAMGNTVAVRLLLEAGAIPDTRGPLEVTPLHLACLNGSSETTEIARLLLQKGADVDAITYPIVFTPLQLAANNVRDSEALTELLLESGARAETPEALNGLVMTPLHLATRMNNVGVCKALIRHHADARRQDYRGNSSLVFAIRNAQGAGCGLLEHLVTGIQFIDWTRESDVATVIAASVLPSPGPLKALLQHAATKPKQLYVAALSAAIRVGRMDNFDSLLDDFHGCFNMEDFDVVARLGLGIVGVVPRDGGGFTVLQEEGFEEAGIDSFRWARLMARQNPAEVEGERLLGFLDHGLVDVEGTVEDDGMTLAQYCCARGTPDMARQLKGKGADFQRLDEKGCSCLHIAATRRNGGESIVRLLLSEEFLVSPFRKSTLGITALEIAIFTGNVDVAKALASETPLMRNLSLDKDGSQRALMAAANLAEDTMLLWLLEHILPSSVNDTTSAGMTVMHAAAEKHGQLTIQRLLGFGADPNIRNKLDRSVMDVAIIAGNISACRAILASDQWQCKDANSRGQTCLHVAASHAQSEIINLFYEDGRLQASRDRSGWSPLDLALAYGHQERIDDKLRVYLAADESGDYERPSAWDTGSEWSSAHGVEADGEAVSLSGQLRLSADVPLLCAGEHGREQRCEKLTRPPYSAFANHPIPPSPDTEYYFEVEILEDGGSMHIGIGLQTQQDVWNYRSMPGWGRGWGYHGDDGKAFTSGARGVEYGPMYSNGDRIGCGIVMSTGTIYYTKNGGYMGIAHHGVRGPLYPMIGLAYPGAHIRASFGLTPPPRELRIEPEKPSPQLTLPVPHGEGEPSLGSQHTPVVCNSDTEGPERAENIAAQNSEPQEKRAAAAESSEQDQAQPQCVALAKFASTWDVVENS
ncbi:ankyrin repeat-containing domain protein [Immersiella caudata]|uniref:Ankyrin repeat-containing domain protein n=1 Tax=Immersiella caudata TaxID=314043 RepID=A0AA39WWP3_9PEZI|nr:ankyrin repeat-containing domain protein [Immersiella caudata]